MESLQEQPDGREGQRSAVTTVSFAHIDEDGVVHWTYRSGAKVDLSAAKEEVGIVGALVDRVLKIYPSGNPEGNKVPLLIDIRPVRKVARNARALLGSNEVSDRWCVSGLALVIKSPISKMIGNATLSWQRPKHPTKLFTDVERAKEWLLEQPPMGPDGLPLSSDSNEEV